MDPNKWGLIRQKDLSLIALPFMYDLNLSEFEIEQINLEYTDELAYTTTSISNTSASVYNAIGVADISDKNYDYLLIPAGVRKTAAYSGLEVSGSDSISRQIWHGSYTSDSYGYNLIDVPPDTIAIHVTMPLGYRFPALGFIRHRTDNVNPRNFGNTKEVNLEQEVTAEPEASVEQKKRK